MARQQRADFESIAASAKAEVAAAAKAMTKAEAKRNAVSAEVLPYCVMRWRCLLVLTAPLHSPLRISCFFALLLLSCVLAVFFFFVFLVGGM